MADTVPSKKKWFRRPGCVWPISIPIIVCSITVLAAHVLQIVATPRGVALPAVDFSGEYVVHQDTKGFNNRGGFTRMPLDQVDRNTSVTVVQDSASLIFTYTDWNHKERTNRIKRIGRFGSKWRWTANGLVGSGLPVRILNLYMGPGLVYYDQRGTLTQTPTGLTLDYTSAEGGALLWIIPWNDMPQRTQIVLTRRRTDKEDRTTDSTVPSESALSDVQ